MYSSYACDKDVSSISHGPAEPPNFRRSGGAVPTFDDFRQRPVRSGLAVATQALQCPRSAFRKISGIGIDTIGLLRDLHSPSQVEEGNALPDDPANNHEQYDAGSVAHRRRALYRSVRYGSVDQALSIFRSALTRDIGGIGNPHVGAPDVDNERDHFNRYKSTVQEASDRIYLLFHELADRDERSHLFEGVCETVTEYGKSGTLLSGGGTLGMYHIGVLKVLHEANPKMISPVISGTSAGSIVASVFASKKDEDLKDAIQELCHGDLEVFRGPDEKKYLSWLRGIWGRRALYNPKNLERVMKNLLGDTLTFRDAFHLTGKQLNIPVSTSGGEEEYRLLNYRTSPDVLIWSAVVASCAVPYAFPAGVLYSRDSEGNITGDSSVAHTDGSLFADIPTEQLAKYFNVNYFVVSQVNPHVVLFLNTDKTIDRWLSYNLFHAGLGLLRNLTLNSVDLVSPLGLSNALLNTLDSLVRQDYDGDVTLFPTAQRSTFWHAKKSLRNPSPVFMGNAVREGAAEARKMLPKLHAVLDVEMKLQSLKRRLHTELKFSKSQEDLHRKEIEERTRRNSSSKSLMRHYRPAQQNLKRMTSSSNVARGRRSRQPSIELGSMPHDVTVHKVAGSEYASECGSEFGSEHDVEEGAVTLESDDDHSDHEGMLGTALASPELQASMFRSHPPSPIETRRRSCFPPSHSTTGIVESIVVSRWLRPIDEPDDDGCNTIYPFRVARADPDPAGEESNEAQRGGRRKSA